jgi:two-component system NtrC family sensor kinase
MSFCNNGYGILTEAGRRDLDDSLTAPPWHPPDASKAEITASVLRNVGSVLNDATISASLIAEKLRNSSVARLARAVSLIQAHKTDLPRFLADDANGRELPSQLCLLAVHMADEQAQILQEVALLTSDIAHIKAIVATQQDQAPGLSTLECGK